MVFVNMLGGVLALVSVLIVMVGLWVRYRREQTYYARDMARGRAVVVPTFWLWFIVLMVAAITLGNPSMMGNTQGGRNTQCINTALVIDVSPSTHAEDAYGGLSRLSAAVLFARRIVERCSSAAFEVVVYAGVVIPVVALPTFDVMAVDFVLEHWIDNREVLLKGSDIHNALSRYAMKRLKPVQASPMQPFGDGYRVLLDQYERPLIRAIVLLSDGGSESGFGRTQIQEMVAKIKVRGINAIHTVGFGGTIPTRIPLYSKVRGKPKKFKRYYNISGGDAITSFEPEVLRDIAFASGGVFVREQDSNALDRVVSQLRQQAGPADKEGVELGWSSYAHYPMAFSLLCVGIALLVSVRYRSA